MLPAFTASLDIMGHLQLHWTLWDIYSFTGHYGTFTASLDIMGHLQLHWTLWDIYSFTGHYGTFTASLDIMGHLQLHWTLWDIYSFTGHYGTFTASLDIMGQPCWAMCYASHKIAAAQNEVALNYHILIVRGLNFIAVIFAATLVEADIGVNQNEYG